MGQKGNLTEGSIEKYIYIIILVIILFQVLAVMYPLGTTAGAALNSSGFPLGSFFVSGGVIWLLLAAAVVILLVRSFMSKSKK
jgi:hypothetical protein